MENKIRIWDFYADWCGPCKMILPVLQAVIDENKDVSVLKIDVEKDEHARETFKVQSVPTLIFFVGDEEKARTVGYVSKPQIEKILASLR